MSQTIRAFVAIELTEAVKAHLADMVGSLRRQGFSGVRWVRPEGIHITLKFLGDVEESMLDAIHEALGGAIHGQSPFSLHLQEAGAFPRLANPRVIWVGLGGDLEALHAVQQGVEQGLVALGIRPEERPFTPHLTVGRVGVPLPPLQRQRLASAIEELAPDVSLAIPARFISLMRSTLLPSGAVYQQLHKVMLTGPSAQDASPA